MAEPPVIERRREIDRSIERVRRVNWMLVVLSLCLGAVLVTLAVVTWDVNDRAKARTHDVEMNQYLVCMILAAHGVREKGSGVCAKYDPLIEQRTNALDRIPHDRR